MNQRDLFLKWKLKYKFKLSFYKAIEFVYRQVLQMYRKIDTLNKCKVKCI